MYLCKVISKTLRCWWHITDECHPPQDNLIKSRLENRFVLQFMECFTVLNWAQTFITSFFNLFNLSFAAITLQYDYSPLIITCCDNHCQNIQCIPLEKENNPSLQSDKQSLQSFQLIYLNNRVNYHPSIITQGEKAFKLRAKWSWLFPLRSHLLACLCLLCSDCNKSWYRKALCHKVTVSFECTLREPALSLQLPPTSSHQDLQHPEEMCPWTAISALSHQAAPAHSLICKQEVFQLKGDKERAVKPAELWQRTDLSLLLLNQNSSILWEKMTFQ